MGRFDEAKDVLDMLSIVENPIEREEETVSISQKCLLM
jgi:hypothetical protein